MMPGRAPLLVLSGLGLVAAVLVVLAGAHGGLASGASHETEVRVAAQLLADGRMEFALQQREDGGGWGERVLPRARFFPAGATVDRWLASSPLTVSTGAGSAELRVAARRLADGRTEFALQQREDGGGWGEHVLPRARFFPAGATVNRWLASSPLTVATATPAPAGTQAEPAETATPAPASVPVETSVATDRAALVALYHATRGPNWRLGRNTNWLTDAPLGEWGGVLTDKSGRVTALVLTGGLLVGSIPPELGNLTSLTKLTLSSNHHLTGPIPPELRNLTSLRGLDLSHNSLSGPIPPEIWNLTSLRSLRLEYNRLSGSIPAEVGNLTSLTRLDLRRNLLSGPIPAEVGNLTSLTALELEANQLTGAIPVELGNLTSLTDLNLGSNQLSGPIPAELGNLTSLTELNLTNNQLSGPIPAELGNLTAADLYLGRNQLSGPIPPELGNRLPWARLELRGNQLSGCRPAGFILADLPICE